MSATDAGDAQRWDEQVGMLAHRVAHTDGSLLALLVGQDGTDVQTFAKDLSSALPPGREVRLLRIDEAHPNPFAHIQDVAAIERVFFVAHGLDLLNPEQRKNSLRLMNWSRAQLSRRAIHLGLWVEPDLLRDLYTYAGDFVDWWQVLLELPTAPNRPDLATGTKDSPWVRLRELNRLYDEEARTIQLGLMANSDRIRELETTIRTMVHPGQVLGGARVVDKIEPNLWRGIALDSGAQVLVHVLTYTGHDNTRRFQDEHDLFVRRKEIRALDGLVVDLLKTDERVLAFVTTLPVGASLGELYLNHPIQEEQEAQVFYQSLEMAQALAQQGLLLIVLCIQDIRLDDHRRPQLTRLLGVVPAGSNPGPLFDRLTARSGALHTRGSARTERAEEQHVVYCMGQLLGFMLTGQLKPAPGDLDTAYSLPVLRRLARVAQAATQHRASERISNLAMLSTATDRAAQGGSPWRMIRLLSPSFNPWLRRPRLTYLQMALAILLSMFLVRLFAPTERSPRHEEQKLREEVLRLRARQEELREEIRSLEDQLDAQTPPSTPPAEDVKPPP